MRISWDSKQWLNRIASAKTKAEYDLCQYDVFANTVEIVKAGSYISGTGKDVVLPIKPDMEEQGILYQDRLSPKSLPRQFNRTNIEVIEEDCLVAARHLFLSTGQVCVLNNASGHSPGGSVIKGPGAQEEYLCKCSDYYRGLFAFATDPRYRSYVNICRHPSYPLDLNYGCCYVPNVTIFRDTEATGYELTDAPWQASMIAIGGINTPETFINQQGERRLTEENEIIIKNKITTLFRVAKLNRQYNLVLTAWGCGAYNNPPKHIAEIFKSIISLNEFWGYFKNIIFAISKPSNGKENTSFKTFLQVFF